jgi:predicted Zn-dependent protease
MDLTAGWRAQNSTQAFTLQSPRGDAQVQLLSLGEARGDLAARLFQALGRAPWATVQRGNRGEFETAVSRGYANGKPYEALAFRNAGQDLLLLGLARDRNGEAPMRDAFHTSSSSLRRLDSGERARLQPLRIHLVKLDRKTTYRDLAKGSPLGADAEATLRLINGDWPDAEPDRGRTIKVIR